MNNLSLHIIDIIQNSIRAGASRISLLISESQQQTIISVADNGKGMGSAELERLGEPFYTSRTTRRVGMGIPLLKQAAEQTGGGLEIESRLGVGTKLTARFGATHPDMPPMGDVANAFALMVGANPEIDFLLEYDCNGEKYSLETTDVKDALQDVPINTPEAIKLLDEMIRNNIESIKNIPPTLL